MHYVYVLKSRKSNKLYIGQTNNLRQRFNEHNKGKNIATKAYTPFELIYYEAFKSRLDAVRRESQLKQYKQGYTRLKERIKYSLEEQS